MTLDGRRRRLPRQGRRACALGRRYVALKLNGNFPGNPAARGLPTIQGAILLCDGETGALLAMIDSIEVTLRRTAAATALAARYLARRDAETILICGCGAQGRGAARRAARDAAARRAFAWDRDSGARAGFRRRDERPGTDRRASGDAGARRREPAPRRCRGPRPKRAAAAVPPAAPRAAPRPARRSRRSGSSPSRGRARMARGERGGRRRPPQGDLDRIDDREQRAGLAVAEQDRALDGRQAARAGLAGKLPLSFSAT